MQAIVTTYTNDATQRAAIVAECRGKRVSVPYDSSLGLDDNHVAAALKLAFALGWRHEWAFACLPLGDYAHVPLRDGGGYTTRPAPGETSPPEYWRGRGGGSLPAPRGR